MCAEKTSTNDKKSQESFYTGMEEMMKMCCPTNEEMSRCCAHFFKMDHPESASKPDIMAMCEMMRHMTSSMGKKSQEG